MITFKCLVVEVNHDGCIDNFETVEIEASALSEVAMKIKRPASFISRTWGIKKAWENGSLVFEGWMVGS